jgi:hypothetical protein
MKHGPSMYLQITIHPFSLFDGTSAFYGTVVAMLAGLLLLQFLEIGIWLSCFLTGFGHCNLTCKRTVLLYSRSKHSKPRIPVGLLC